MSFWANALKGTLYILLFLLTFSLIFENLQVLQAKQNSKRFVQKDSKLSFFFIGKARNSVALPTFGSRRSNRYFKLSSEVKQTICIGRCHFSLAQRIPFKFKIGHSRFDPAGLNVSKYTNWGVIERPSCQDNQAIGKMEAGQARVASCRRLRVSYYFHEEKSLRKKLRDTKTLGV